MLNTSKIVASIVGQELYDALNKSIMKMGTKSVVDITELHDALKIAPKSIIAFLMRELGSMKKDEAKEVKLPWDDQSTMLINKKDEDVYAGRIARAGKVEHEFELCSIPQLAAHLLSFSEMYDQVPDTELSPEKSTKEESDADIYAHLKILDDKVNALLMMVVSQSPIQKNEKLNKSSLEIDDDDEILELQTRAALKNFINSIKGLKKAGLAPKMPSPPKAGSNVGGNNGLTQAGIHGDKTAHTDLNTKPVTQIKNNPFLKVPKATAAAVTQAKPPKTLAQSEKTMIVKKSELTNKCADCKQVAINCACFRVLSKPEIKKSEGQNITLKFRSDWDSDSISALYKSLKRIRD